MPGLIIVDPPTPRPTLEPFAESLYAALEPIAVATDSERSQWSLAHFCGAIGAMFQPIDTLARDSEDGPGWSAVMDLDRTPWLPWLAQFVGVTVVPETTDAEQRERILGTAGFKRGTVASMRAAAALHLTGTKTVLFRERDGSAYRLEVVTYTDETPDPDATLADLMAQKPAGILLAYRHQVGNDYQAVVVHDDPGEFTYAELTATFADYADLLIAEEI